ncbi:MAG: MlaD family protein [Armatimonadetes bacterium]|nr:MlaD family protein [Armatimonadota bacterium]MDW8121112.1 MlaD family protein [Armatimonadota bacterium]
MVMTRSDQQYHARRAGLLALLGVGVVIATAFWLRSFIPRIGGTWFVAEFKRVAGLEEGSEVYVQGVQAGTVERVEIDPPNKVRVTVRLTEPFPVYHNSKVAIGVGALIPRPYVDITNPDVPGPIVQPGDVIKGWEPVSVEEILPRLVRFIDDFREILGSPQTQEHIRLAIADVAASAANLRRLTGAIGPQDVRETVRHLRSLATRLDALAGSPQWQAAAKNVEETTARLARLTADPRITEGLPRILDQTRETVESLRKLVADPDTQSRIRSALAHIEESSQLLKKALSDEGTIGRLNDLLTDSRQLVASVEEIVSQPQVKESLGKTLTNLEALASRAHESISELEGTLAELRELISGSKENWQTLVANLASISEDLDAITEGLKWLITEGGLKENLRVIGENLKAGSEDLRYVVQKIRTLLTDEKTTQSLQEGLQQVGPTLSLVRRTAEKGQRILDRLEPLTQWESQARASLWLTPETDQIKGETGLHLHTKDLRTSLLLGSYTDQEGSRLNLLIQGKINPFLVWRSGVIRSRLGAGIGWVTGKVHWDLEAFDPDRWQVNSWLRWSLLPSLSLRLGIEDLGRRRDFGVGLEAHITR